MRITKLATFVLFVLSFHGAVHAQSMKIDVGTPPTTPPSATYAGAAALSGPWCAVGAAGISHTLVDVHGNGVETAAARTTSTQMGVVINDPATAGNDAALLDDGQMLDAQLPVTTWTIGPMWAGTYSVTTYAWQPLSPTSVTRVSVTGAAEGFQDVGGAWTGAHAQGVTFARHSVLVPLGASIEITCSAQTATGFVNGFQIALQEPGTAFCFGDGVLTSCPCSNHTPVDYGRGCRTWWLKSVNLFVTGFTTSDSIVLTAHEEHANGNGGLRLFVQGSATHAPVAFGAGLRCVSGSLLRLYQRASNSLAASVPGGSDPSITARSAALGDPIAPGSSRSYFVYFRDPGYAACSPQGTTTFNSSNAYTLVW